MHRPYRILFVCLGNICRSPAAEIIFRQQVADSGRAEEFEIDSAGTIGHHAGSPPDSRMAESLGRHGFNSINWWGAGGIVRAGVIPTQTGCVNGVSAIGVTDTPGPLGERSNGALTIQLIDPNTPELALEMNGSDYRSGWRVNGANFMTYVLAEWTVFWHHPNGKCYGQAGWVPNPPQEVESGTPSLPPSGTADPRGPIPPNPTPIP